MPKGGRRARRLQEQLLKLTPFFGAEFWAEKPCTLGQYPSCSGPAGPNTSLGMKGLLCYSESLSVGRRQSPEQAKTTPCPTFKARGTTLVGKLPRLLVQHIRWTAACSTSQLGKQKPQGVCMARPLHQAVPPQRATPGPQVLLDREASKHHGQLPRSRLESK